MKKSSKSTIVCILGSLLLAVFVSVLAILISVKIGFASEYAIMNAMDDADYYLIVYNDFMGKCESLAIPNGLNGAVFNGVFSMEQMCSDGRSYLKAELNSTTFEINLKGYKQKLSKNIYAHVIIWPQMGIPEKLLQILQMKSWIVIWKLYGCHMRPLWV